MFLFNINKGNLRRISYGYFIIIIDKLESCTVCVCVLFQLPHIPRLWFMKSENTTSAAVQYNNV